MGPVRQVGRLMDGASLHVDDSGNSDSRSRKLETGIKLLAQGTNRIADIAHDQIPAALHLGAGSDEFQLFAAAVERGNAHICAAKIDADGKPLRVISHERPREPWIKCKRQL